MGPTDFDKALRSRDEDVVVRALKTAARDRVPARTVQKLLLETQSPRIRNAAALALADMRFPEAPALLIEVLKRPETKGARGTLLYALDELNAKVPLTILVRIIAEDTYEAREEALDLLFKTDYGAQERSQAISRLRPLASSGDKQVRQAATEAMERLSAS